MLYYRSTKVARLIVLCGLFFIPLIINASIHPKQQQANKAIKALYHSLEKFPKSNMQTRLEIISRQFLGRTYLLGALGEGSHAYFDQEPRYRTDAFDCDTYVTTVLALALAKDKEGFKQCMSKIRYKEGQVDFITRNHFTSLDWNPNNQRQGFIKDITSSFKDKNNQPVMKIATALINKPSWYQHFSIQVVRLNPPNTKEQAKRLAELKTQGARLPRVYANIPYLPLTALFDSQGNANHDLFAQIPEAAIIEIVRPNWNLKKQIGTNLNVSHLGFAFWKKNTLYFRQASSKYGQVVDVSLVEYLRDTLTSLTIKGINVQIVIPQEPLTEHCTFPIFNKVQTLGFK